jgi:hypothetical protein
VDDAVVAFFLIVGIVVLLVAMGIWDHRTRKHGHTLRRSGDIRRMELDVRRNVRAADQTWHNPIDPDWATPDERRSRP